MAIGQRQKWPLDRIVEKWGGKIYSEKRRNYNTWYLHGVAAYNLLTLLYPHLSPYRQMQIECVTEWWQKRQSIREQKQAIVCTRILDCLKRNITDTGQILVSTATPRSTVYRALRHLRETGQIARSKHGKYHLNTL